MCGSTLLLYRSCSLKGVVRSLHDPLISKVLPSVFSLKDVLMSLDHEDLSDLDMIKYGMMK